MSAFRSDVQHCIYVVITAYFAVKEKSVPQLIKKKIIIIKVKSVSAKQE